MSGLEVIREIKERAKRFEIYANLKIFVVTGGGLSDEETYELL